MLAVPLLKIQKHSQLPCNMLDAKTQPGKLVMESHLSYILKGKRSSIPNQNSNHHEKTVSMNKLLI